MRTWSCVCYKITLKHSECPTQNLLLEISKLPGIVTQVVILNSFELFCLLIEAASFHVGTLIGTYRNSLLGSYSGPSSRRIETPPFSLPPFTPPGS